LNSGLPGSLPFGIELGELSDVIGDVDLDDFEVRVSFAEVLGQSCYVAVGFGHIDQHQSSKEKTKKNGFRKLVIYIMHNGESFNPPQTSLNI